MSKENRPCEAPNHVDGCCGLGSTRDHFTPKCIGKLLGWKTKQINAPANIQWLSPECHTEKDRDTSLRKELLQRQLNEDLAVSFPVHREIFDKGNLKPLQYQAQPIEMKPGVEYLAKSG